MEPALVYMSIVAAALGVWILGDRVWAFALRLAEVERTGHIVSRFVLSSVSLAIALTFARVGPVLADTVPQHHRVIVNDNGSAAPISLASPWLLTATDDRPSPIRSEGTYVVVRGDSLWKIARSVLSEGGARPSGAEIGAFWRSVYDTNRDVIGANPNLIFPGQILELPQR